MIRTTDFIGENVTNIKRTLTDLGIIYHAKQADNMIKWIVTGTGLVFDFHNNICYSCVCVNDEED